MQTKSALSEVLPKTYCWLCFPILPEVQFTNRTLNLVRQLCLTNWSRPTGTRVRSLSGNGYSRQKRYLEIRRLVSVSWTFCGACAHRARWQRQWPTSPPWLRFNDPILLEASESLKSWKCKSIKINKPVYSAGSERFISVGEFKLSDTVKTFSVARYRN